MVKKIVRKLLPKSAVGMLRESRRELHKQLNRGDRYECPCCGHRTNQMMTYGTMQRPNVQCPECKSLDRDRLQWLFFQRETDLFTRPNRLLHIAPEASFRRNFEVMSNLDYVTADLYVPGMNVTLDVTQMPFASETFDVILCNHVLEHVPDDRRAMRELRRILKADGWAILQVPLPDHYGETEPDVTFEDPTAVTEEDRRRLFRQGDHVRLYGWDYKDRLAESGFQVNVVDYRAQLSPDEAEHYNVTHEKIYHCTR